MARASAVLWAGVGLLLAALTGLGAAWLPGRATGVRVGTAERMNALSAYLAPVEAPPVEGGSAGPVGDPFRAPLAAQPETGPRPARPAGPRVSAILITEDRRVAIVDERVVRPGDVLPGGSRVASIERGVVVLVGRDGRRQVLRIETGEGG